MAVSQAISPIDLDQRELRDILDALGSFPKAANREIRAESAAIAEDIMVPAIKSAILSHAGPFGPKLSKAVIATTDRIPAVKVGNNAGGSGNRRVKGAAASAAGLYSGGATTNMLRFGTIKGGYISRKGSYQFWADRINAPSWTDAADAQYYEPAFTAWTNRAEALIDRWNRGADY